MIEIRVSSVWINSSPDMDQDNVQTTCQWQLRHKPCTICGTVCYCHGKTQTSMVTSLPVNWCCTGTFVHGGNHDNWRQRTSFYENKQSSSICQEKPTADVTSLDHQLSRNSLLCYYHGYHPCYCVDKQPKQKTKQTVVSLPAQQSLITTYQADYGPKIRKVINKMCTNLCVSVMNTLNILMCVCKHMCVNVDV